MNIKRRTKIWINVSLLLLAFTNIGILAEARYSSDGNVKSVKSKDSGLHIVDWIGSRVAKGYKWIHKEQSESALANLAEGNSESCINLLHDWFYIKKGDRAYPFKRKVLAKLAMFLHARGRYEELKYWSEHWYGLNDRDITAGAYFFESLTHFDEHFLEGQQKLKSHFHRFPSNPVLKKLMRKQDKSLAIDFNLGWKLYWNTSRGFNEQEAKIFDLISLGDNRWEVKIDASNDVTQWRIDPPEYSLLEISEIVLVTEDNLYPVLLEHVNLNEMYLGNDSLTTDSGEDPYLILSSDCVKAETDVLGKVVAIRLKVTSGFVKGSLR